MTIKSLTALALLGVLALGAPLAYAETPAAAAADANADVSADVGAIAKDDAALAKDNATLEENRASKAAAKASGNTVDQAVDSVKIGANHVGIAQKKTEKHVDKKILKHHVKKAHKANVKAGVSTDTTVDPNAAVQ